MSLGVPWESRVNQITLDLRSRGLAGSMVWALDLDEFQLLGPSTKVVGKVPDFGGTGVNVFSLEKKGDGYSNCLWCWMMMMMMMMMMKYHWNR